MGLIIYLRTPDFQPKSLHKFKACFILVLHWLTLLLFSANHARQNVQK